MARLVVGEVRFSFMQVHQPRAIQPGDEPKYSVVLMIPKTNKALVKQIQDAIAAEMAGPKLAGKKKIKNPLKDGDAEDERDEYEGHYILRASSARKPFIVGPDGQPLDDAREIYSGCYGRASIDIFGYAHPTGGPGVSCGLNSIKKLRDGESFGGSYTESDALNELGEDEGEEEDFTK